MKNTTQTTFLASAPFSRLSRWVFRLLGGRPDEPAESIRVNIDLCLAQAVRRAQRYADMALPQALLQAFPVEPLAAGDARLVERKQQSDRLLAALGTWRTGHGSMVAVTGPQGSGITTFLQQLATQVGDHEAWRYGELTHRPYDINDTLAQLCAIVGCEQPVDSVEQLLEYLNGMTPSIIAIDNGHFLACRIMGANEAIRVFGAVMVATQQRHFWVLGCEQYAWRRLAYVYRADRFFSGQIELPLFSEAELGQCLTARLQASGITPDTGTSTDHPQSLPALARQLTTLHRLSNGKPDFAFFYLLGSLVIDEHKLWDIQPLVELDFSLLKQLISEELFTLAEVAAHGQLSVDDHRAVFRCSREESWLLLERLYHQCLLDRNGTGAEPAYHLVPVYSDVITRFLNNANYLY